MTMLNIEQSVGLGGHNKPIDVALIQRLLKAYFTQTLPIKGRSSMVRSPSIQVDGECSPALIDLIKDFQSQAVGAKRPDGRIDPHGKALQTMTSLLQFTGGGTKNILFGPLPGNTDILPKVDPGRFRKFFGQQLGLTVTKGEDLLGFFGFLQKDKAIADIRWATYMLATAYAETEFSFLSVEEKGKGADRPYGKKQIEVTDVQGYRGPRNATYKNVYYGRGYCQLTWMENYQELGKLLGLGDELYINPAKAVEKKVAYDIISYGMRHGTFTGKKLSDHINGKKCDYKNARQIINGRHDREDEIAGYAEQIELLLRLCAGSASTLSNDLVLVR